MLTYIELPGVYVQPDKSYICAIDNIEAGIIQNNPKSLTIKLTNSTKADASVKVFAESSGQAQKPLGENALWNCSIIQIKPGESREIVLKK